MISPVSSDVNKATERHLTSVYSEHRKVAGEATAGIFEPWTAVNRALMLRSIERGELPDNADIEMACEVIVSMTSHRSLTQSKPFDKAFYGTLLDNILLPALKTPYSSFDK